MRFNFKKAASLGILPFMLLSGCGGSSDVKTDTGTTTAYSESSAHDPLPKADYGGAKITILNSFFDWCIYQMDSEEMNGEIFNDAVFERNTALEERLNITLDIHEKETSDTAMKKLESLILADDPVYDAAYLSVLVGSPKAAEGYYLDLYGIDTLDFSAPWWNQRSIPSYELKGKLYFAHGYGQIQYFDCLWSLYFNQTLINDLKMDDPYQLVLDGTWTIDKFNAMMTAAAQDLDGNSVLNEHDRWGMTCINGASLAMLHSAGESAVTMTDGTPVVSKLTDRLMGVYEKIQETLAVPHVRIQNDDLKEKLFLGNQSLFYGETLGHAAELRVMNADFGVVPYPKYDESQKDYASYMSPSAMGVYIPATVRDPERSGTVIECLNALSIDSLLPVYYDLVLGEKHLRDENSKKIIDIMFEGAESELAYVYRWNNYQQTIMDMLVFGNPIASTLESTREATEAAIAKFMEKLE